MHTHAIVSDPHGSRPLAPAVTIRVQLDAHQHAPVLIGQGVHAHYQSTSYHFCKPKRTRRWDGLALAKRFCRTRYLSSLLTSRPHARSPSVLRCTSSWGRAGESWESVRAGRRHEKGELERGMWGESREPPHDNMVVNAAHVRT